MIFVASPGRCGTKYLAKMLEVLPGVEARHEAPPDFASCAYEAQADANIAARFWRDKKLPAIRRSRAEVYVETSHVFTNGFAEALVSLGVAFDVVFLLRMHRDVALSYWRRRSIPGRTERGRMYLARPDGDVCLQLRDWTQLDDYQLCYWHCLETEARCGRLIWKFNGSTTYAMTMNRLVDGSGFRELVQEMGLPRPADWRGYEARREWVVNANPENYYRVWPEGELAELEAGVRDALT